MQIALALAVTIVSACCLNLGYLLEHRAASRLPPLSPRHPLRSARILLATPGWLAGFAVEALGWCGEVLAEDPEMGSIVHALSLIDTVSAGAGETLHTETFREEVLYNANQTTPALSSYFELMDRLLPAFLNTLSAQKIKGTRTLLK